MKIYKVKVNGKMYQVELESVNEVQSNNEAKEIVKESSKATKSSNSEGQEILAPIQGSIVDIKVKVGSKVKKGDVLLLIEAMKLQNEVNAPCDGEIVEISVNKGQAVTAKQLLVKIK